MRNTVVPLLTFLGIGVIGDVLIEDWQGPLGFFLVLLVALLIAGTVRHAMVRSTPAK